MKWTKEDLRAALLVIFAQHAQLKVELTHATQIVGDLGIDSLGVMEVVADIEDKFGVNIPDEALPELSTIGDVTVAIEKRLGDAGRLAG